MRDTTTPIGALADKLDEKPYSGIPLENRRDWVVPKWLKELFVGFALLCVASVGASKLAQHFGGKVERAAGSLEADLLDGSTAQDFALPLRGGGKITLADLRGKMVLVNFWASWCAPCRAEEPSLDRLARVFDRESFQVLAISADDGWAPVEKFFGARVPAYRVALDESGEVHDRWGTNVYPESYLIDSNGALRYKFIGGRDWDGKEAIALLTAMGARPLVGGPQAQR